MNTASLKHVAVAVCVSVTAQLPADSDIKYSDNGVPGAMKLIIASFGTIDSQAEVESHLSDLIRPLQNSFEIPKLDNVEKIQNPELAAEALVVDWKERTAKYWRESEYVREENSRREKILYSLKAMALGDSSQRYVIMGRDYLQAALFKKVGRLIRVIDRGNMTIQQTEKHIRGDGVDVVNGADCVVTIVMGDREEATSVVPIDNAGTKIRRTTYAAPYICKIRDLQGNLIFALNGKVSVKTTTDNVVDVSSADPARKLVEKICEEVAEKIAEYFTMKLKFKIKAPDGFDADDAEVIVNGKTVNGQSKRVLRLPTSVTGKLPGCKTIKLTVEADDEEAELTVKMNFKKIAKSAEDNGGVEDED